MTSIKTTLAGAGALLLALAGIVSDLAGFTEQATVYLVGLAAALSGVGNMLSKDADAPPNPTPEGPP